MAKPRFLLILVAALLCVFLLWPQTLPGWERPTDAPARQSRQLHHRLQQALHCISPQRQDLPAPLNQNGIDMLESLLIQEGCSTLDTHSTDSAYLANPQPLLRFYAGEAPSATVFQLTGTSLSCLHFFTQGRDRFCLTALVEWDSSGAPFVQETQLLPLYDMDLVQENTLYYRLYPAGDPHYIDYAYFRLTPPNPDLEELCRQCIQSVGYRFVNLFLCDWDEGHWGELSLPDLFEYLSPLETGQPVDFSVYPAADGDWVQVPQAQMAAALSPYFQMDEETLAQRCGFRDGYCLWRPIHGDDLTVWELPLYLPEVTACQTHPDGTKTLQVQVRCPEYKCNDYFTHEVTIRPTETGFQYVSNRITSGREHLPPSASRRELFPG